MSALEYEGDLMTEDNVHEQTILEQPDRMLGLNEVCRCVGNVNRATLYRWAAKGTFPYIRRFGGKSGVLLSDLNRWLQTRPSIGEK